MTRRRAKSLADADLVGALGNRVGLDAVHADHRQEQRERAERGEDGGANSDHPEAGALGDVCVERLQHHDRQLSVGRSDLGANCL